MFAVAGKDVDLPLAMDAGIEQILRQERPRTLATLIRLLGDFHLAEESLQSAILAALEKWPQEGVPQNPRAWLISAARFKGIDSLRKDRRFIPNDHLLNVIDASDRFHEVIEDLSVEDDQLRLIFACCHPALPLEGRVALTLREVCGLTTSEIAHGYLVPDSTIAQRIVRAKAKIRDDRIPYEIPGSGELGFRLASVLKVMYLLFNEGYFASTGEVLFRQVLCREAIRLTRLIAGLFPVPEVLGLLGLMLLQEARSATRSSQGGVVLFDDQDPANWDSVMIQEGMGLVQQASAVDAPGPYTLQAAIVAHHVHWAIQGNKDWRKIVELYDQLLLQQPSEIIELNRAVAVSHVKGAAAGLAIVDGILGEGNLENYSFAHSTRAEFCRKLGLVQEARSSYLRALELTGQTIRRRFLQDRLDGLAIQ